MVALFNEEKMLHTILTPTHINEVVKGVEDFFHKKSTATVHRRLFTTMGSLPNSQSPQVSAPVVYLRTMSVIRDTAQHDLILRNDISKENVKIYGFRVLVGTWERCGFGVTFSDKRTKEEAHFRFYSDSQAAIEDIVNFLYNGKLN